MPPPFRLSHSHDCPTLPHASSKALCRPPLRQRTHHPRLRPTAARASALDAPLLVREEDPAANRQRLRVVLVSPKHQGNVGACARLLANFGVPELVLVAPRCDPLGEEARRLSVGSPCLETAFTVDSLQEALADTTGSVAFTRHSCLGRDEPQGYFSSIQGLQRAVPTLRLTRRFLWPRENPEGIIALVFGREESGLTFREATLCNWRCCIPSSPNQPSLNLSHAVAVVLSQLYEAQAMQPSRLPYGLNGPEYTEPATSAQVEHLLAKLSAICGAVGLESEEYVSTAGNHAKKRRATGHVRALLARCRPTKKEVGALHALCNRLGPALAAKEEDAPPRGNGTGGGGDVLEAEVVK